MSHPFGPKCTVGEYLDWAVKQQCVVKDGLLGFKCRIRIATPSGRYAIVFDMTRALPLYEALGFWTIVDRIEKMAEFRGRHGVSRRRG